MQEQGTGAKFAMSSGNRGPKMRLEVRVIGPLTVRRAGVALSTGPPKQRALLALLLLYRRQTLSREQIVDELWGSGPPPSAIANLRSYLTNVRRLLAPEGRISCRAGRYQLLLDRTHFDIDIDLDRLTELADQRGSVGEVDALGTASTPALVLCRDEPLEDVPAGRLLGAARDRLLGQQLAVVENLFAARLAAG
ncbi:winged helix-turn-helix domain-containing protein [Micromonospora sp. WMMD1102]|uniref:AfsR/SARP family transcriptional regulator n=1 Tax=Micromonospora sp. WMMD1102 TaxID=3016105 RepID=UPI00241519C2|nr:winged helix-turn-helix domain-containing protein [Micromonospora sp. WMMD1102]MDG4791400.1 winged helix-turn-helix domain-containing protein [Micromonospora sp. WMMD1102]